MNGINVKFLNRKTLLVGLAVFVITLSGIGYLLTLNNASQDNELYKSTPVATYNVGDSIALDNNFSLLVEQAQITRDPVGNRPADGTDWVNVQVTATNSGQDGVIIGQYAKYLTDHNGNTYVYHATDLTHKYAQTSNRQFDQPLQGPDARTGWLGFEVPRHATGLTLIIKSQQQSSGTIKVPLNIGVN
jgi:hypothetical protein